MTLPLFKHQQTSIDFGKDLPCVFDTSDPGTGKTRVYIELLQAHPGKTLVICPKSLMRPAWDADIRKFAPHLITSVAYSSNREAAFQANADVYITNHDAAVWLAKQHPTFFREFTKLIIDESGAFKHSTSMRSKAMLKIAKHFKWRYALNGTPNPNTITDIWHQIKILDDGKHLGPVFFAFRNSVCTPKQVGPQPNMVKWEDRPGAHEAVSILIKDMTIRHKFEECLSIPENFMYTMQYFMPPKQKKAYDQMAVAEIAALPSGVVSAINAAAVMTKLLQIASGAVYETPEKYHVIDRERYEMILDLIEEREHSITFFLWKHQRDLLTEEARKRGVSYAVIDGTVPEKERTEIVRRYQQGMYKVLFAHPQSAAHGLTLTKGTTTIWASPTYNLEHFQQGNRRIYRAGQTQKTETVVILAEDSCEQKVYDALMNKNVRMDTLLDLMKELK
jgi:SNF2 family DNA or RNA helicase